MDKIKKQFQRMKAFGFRVVFINLLFSCYSYWKRQNSIAYFIFKCKNDAILDWLEKKYVPKDFEQEVLRCVPQQKKAGIVVNSCIWSFWWQGLSDMPRNIENCIENMKKFSSGHNVIVITKDNWNEYLDIPEWITSKLNKGLMTITQFSDILRMNLLFNYGGLWLDAAIFPVCDIPHDIFERNYFTRKDRAHKEGNVSDSRWCGGLTGGNCGFVFFAFMICIFNNYWRENDLLIDYFLIDYLTELAYRYIMLFREVIDNNDYNNIALYAIEPFLNKEYENNKELIDKILEDNTFLRLKWREKYGIKTTEGKTTIYGYLFG